MPTWVICHRLSSPSPRLHVLAMRWNGGSWQTFPLPGLRALPSDFLAGLASTSILAASDPDNLWITVNVLHAPYLLHWDGTGWSVVPIPVPIQSLYGGVAGDGTGGLRLSAVSNAPGPPLYLQGRVSGTSSEQTVPAVTDGTTEVNALLLILGTTLAWSVGYSVSAHGREIRRPC